MAMGAGAATRISQVPEQLQRLEKELTELHARLDGLAERMQSVLRPSTPTPEKAKPETRPALTALAESLQGFGDTIRAASGKVESYIERLEL